jgi:hypothetical protein
MRAPLVRLRRLRELEEAYVRIASSADAELS